MDITIFGATGKTGRLIVAQALERGHRVKAFTRSPDKLGASDLRLEVVVGDVQDPEAVARAVGGSQAVISVLGPTQNVPDYQVSRGTEHILRAMDEHGVDRLIVTAGAGVADERDEPGIPNRFIKALLLVFARHVYEDMRRTVEIVRASDIDWTIVRLPMLADGPPKSEIRVGYVGKGTGARIVRADIARFVLDELEQGKHIHDAPVISN